MAVSLPPVPRQGRSVLLAGMLLALVLGSVHAFSVFLEPLEARFGADRARVSLTYSLALVALTAAVLLGHLVLARLAAAWLALAIGLAAALGCWLAGQAQSLSGVWLGYGLLFGAANGLGYALALQISAQANPGRRGLAMGLVTACYALGAVLAPLPFDALLGRGGFAAAMGGLAAALLVAALLAAALLAFARARLQVSPGPAQAPAAADRRLTATLWLGYGTAVAAGLMAIGHATGIARAGSLGGALVLAAPAVIALFNLLGSLLGGWLADRLPFKWLLCGCPALSAAALFLLALADRGPTVLLGLAAIGFAYGAVITAYPAAVSRLFGAVAGVRAYGRVFTAWGLAGLLAPWCAGLLYERLGDYRAALAIAGCSALMSLLTAQALPAKRQA